MMRYANKSSIDSSNIAGRPTASSNAAKAERGVTFKATATMRTYSSSNSSMAQEEKSKLYYSKQELNSFILEAKVICSLSQGLPHISNSGTLLDVSHYSMIPLGNNNDDDEDATESLRGLEILMYPKRNQNKLIAHKTVLKYQALLNSKSDVDGEQKYLALAAASAKLNLWSTLIAVETARRDSVRAYERDYKIWIEAPGPLSAMSPYSLYMNRRRSREVMADADGANQQSKRRKIGQI